MSFKTGKNILEGFGHLTSSPASPEDGKEPNIGKETSHQSVLAVDHDKGIVAIDTLQEAEQFGDNEDISNKASLIVDRLERAWKQLKTSSSYDFTFTFIILLHFHRLNELAWNAHHVTTWWKRTSAYIRTFPN